MFLFIEGHIVGKNLVPNNFCAIHFCNFCGMWRDIIQYNFKEMSPISCFKSIYKEKWYLQGTYWETPVYDKSRELSIIILCLSVDVLQSFKYCLWKLTKMSTDKTKVTCFKWNPKSIHNPFFLKSQTDEFKK